MKSMTGFGRHEMFIDNRRFSVELKAVNHKFCEISIKLPRFLNEHESFFRQILADKISRGKVDVYINFETFSEKDYKISFNEQLGNVYYNQLNQIIDAYSLEDKVKLSHILSFPDVLKSEKNLDDEALIKTIVSNFSETLKTALSNFVTMREAEGEKLGSDIVDKLETFNEILLEIEKAYPQVAKDYKENLSNKATELLGVGNFDENRILMEVMIFSDKACIDEELVRLHSHMDQFASILKEECPIGRKLDFLIQEINREINTIASKSSDINITKNVVELKTLLEKIREQVQNIE